MSGHPTRLEAVLAPRYALERELGHGGTATVYLAHDRKHERPVAIKVLNPELAAAVGAERFLREIKLTARLTHPHILPVHDSGIVDGFLYYVMPYVEGESLRDRLEREGPLPVAEVVRIGREVAEALAYAHAQGIVHRDIKPENVLLEEGHAVIGDFGVAHALEAAGEERLTQTGLAVGTSAYMSPEQATGDEQVDGRSDLYALGCMLYEMLVGSPPLTGPTVQGTFVRRLTETPPPLRKQRESIPEELDEAIQKSLARAPTDRYASAVEFGAALRSTSLSQRSVAASADAGGVGRAVLGVGLVYLVAAFFGYQAVRLVASGLGLPEWVPPSTLVLLAVGLPILLATAFLERGGTLTVPWTSGAKRRPFLPKRSLLYRLLTWRNAILGGVAAFALLGVVTTGYLVMRAAGVGPAGTLVAKGVLEEKERIVLADFGSLSGDDELAAAASLAVRVDLGESPIVTMVEPRAISSTLQRMDRNADAELTRDLAMEVAIREGIKAVIVGDVSRAGKNFVVSAEVIAAADGQQLLAHRETAGDSAGIVSAIDRLSRKLRERMGESLRSIAASPRLEEVTTSSMEALRLYSDAVEAIEVTGNRDRGIALLREAIERDSAFAMGWRKLGAELGNLDRDRAQEIEALTKAYEHRDRLTKRERYLADAAYYGNVLDDRNRVITVYRNLLDLNPEDTWALNNLAIEYLMLDEPERAEELSSRALGVDSSSAFHVENLLGAQLDQGKVEEAKQTATAGLRLFPSNPSIRRDPGLVAFAEGDYETAAEIAREVRGDYPEEPGVQRASSFDLFRSLAVRGKVAGAREALRAARRADEERSDASGYWGAVLTEAFMDLELREDTAAALERVSEAEGRFRLRELPPLERPYDELARLHARAGRPDVARSLLDRFEAESDPELWTPDQKRLARLAQGDIALAEGDVALATEIYREVDREACSVCEALDLARAYDRAGEADSTIAYWEAYIRTPDYVRVFIDPTNLGPAQERLGQLYDERDDVESAARHYARFLELWAEADSELQPRVRAAQERLQEIAVEQG